MSKSPELRVALIQYDIAHSAPHVNRQTIERLLAQLPKDTDLVVLPEMFTTGFGPHAVRDAEAMDGPTVEWMKAMSRSHGIFLMGSLPVREGASIYNRLIGVSPEGQLHYIDKRHLFSYMGEDKAFAAGQMRGVWHWKGWSIMPAVCYDLRFPVWLRNDLQYDLLIVVANWPVARIEAWKTLLKARAIENQAYVVGVNRIGRDANEVEYGGYSSLIRYDGAVMLQAGEVETILHCRIDHHALYKFRTQFPFLDDRDAFTIQLKDA